MARTTDFFFIFPPFVSVGLSSPPVGIQHLAWNARASGFIGEAVDSNIEFCRELISDQNIEALLKRVAPDSREAIRLRSMLRIDETARGGLPSTYSILRKLSEELSGASPLGLRLLTNGRSQTLDGLIDRLRDARPRLIGFSVISESQIPFAGWLAERIREQLPSMMVLGGPELSGWPRDQLLRLAKAARVDCVVLGHGEWAVRRLLAPNAPSSCSTPQIMQGVRMPLSDVAVAASFQLDARNYFGASYYNVVESRGCYWAACSHCDYVALNPERDYGREPEALAQAIDTAARTTGVHRFGLVNDSLAPDRAVRFAQTLVQRGSPARWSSFVRIDRRLNAQVLKTLAAAHCRYLVVGVESLEDRTLRLLKKGYSSNLAAEWLMQAHFAGLNLALNFMVCIPGTSAEDEEVTLRRLEQMPELAECVKVYRFVLSRLSPMGRAPHSFDIEVEDELPGRVGHRGGSSMQMRDASELDVREAAFRNRVADLAAKSTLSREASWFLLALDRGYDVPAATLDFSPRLEVGECHEGTCRQWLIRDHLLNAEVLVDWDCVEFVDFVRGRSFELHRLLSKGDWTVGSDYLCDLVLALGRTGSISISSEVSPDSGQARPT